MSIQFIWQLPTASDSRPSRAGTFKRAERDKNSGHPYSEHVTDPRKHQFNYFDYLTQIAKAADFTHFDGIKIEHDVQGDESWIVAGVLSRATRHLNIIAEFEASRGSAVYAAKNAVSFQRYSNSRFDWAITKGDSLSQRKSLGDFLPEEKINQRIGEFITVSRGVTTQNPYTFKGQYFEVLNGGFKGPLANNKTPTIYLAGDTPDDIETSAQYADVHTFTLDNEQTLSNRIVLLKESALKYKREVEIALRVDLLVRETNDEALNDARRYWEQTNQHAIAENKLAGLYNDARLTRLGPSNVLVGSYDTITLTLAKLSQLGITQFIFSNHANLEEAYRVGEYLLPRLRVHLNLQTPFAQRRA